MQQAGFDPRRLHERESRTTVRDDAGEHELKGVPDRLRLYKVVA